MLLIRPCLLLALLAICGCQSAKPLTVSPQFPGPGMVRPLINSQWPQSVQVYKTTAGSIYLSNVDASISSLERLYGDDPSARHGSALANRLYHRYKILGRIEDAENALEIIRQVTNQPQANADSFLIQADILSGFHLFADALAALEGAKTLGGEFEQIEYRLREIKTAIGDYDFSRSVGNDFRVFVNNAEQALLRDDFIGASINLRQAERTYDGINPYALAWIQLQQGIAFLRYGDYESAYHFFTIAHERMPEYYLVTEHMAEAALRLDKLTEAERLYQQVSTQTGNPQFHAQLARVKARLGDQSASEQLYHQADSGYEKLLARHPELAGDHAVTYYLSRGEDKTALQLAHRNLQNRHDIASWILLANTALAVNKKREACQALQSALQLGVQPVELQRLQQQLKDRCH